MQTDLFGDHADESLEGGWPLPRLPDPPGLHVGSCAWNHGSFDRHFYPQGLPSSEQLRFYARRFNAVEVDSSFYRTPSISTVQRWLGAVPESFRFAVKAPRAVTHDGALDLNAAAVRAEWDTWVDRLWRFGPALGAAVIQLGPRSTILQFDRLRQLTDTLAPAIPTVIEFRHPTWNCAEVSAWLDERGVVRAWADHYNDPTRGVTTSTPHLYPKSGGFRYIRLLGDVSSKYNPNAPEGRNFSYGNVLFDRDADLTHWTQIIREELRRGIPIHLFINNHYQGFTPITVDRIRDALAEEK